MTETKQLKVRSLDAVSGEIEVPGDKSISHRVAIIGGLSNGACHVRNFLPSEDCLNTLQAMQSLGVKCEVIETNQYGPVEVLVHGAKMHLKQPEAPIDCGNSGTGMRLRFTSDGRSRWWLAFWPA